MKLAVKFFEKLIQPTIDKNNNIDKPTETSEFSNKFKNTNTFNNLNRVQTSTNLPVIINTNHKPEKSVDFINIKNNLINKIALSNIEQIDIHDNKTNKEKANKLEKRLISDNVLNVGKNLHERIKRINFNLELLKSHYIGNKEDKGLVNKFISKFNFRSLFVSEQSNQSKITTEDNNNCNKKINKDKLNFIKSIKSLEGSKKISKMYNNEEEIIKKLHYYDFFFVFPQENFSDIPEEKLISKANLNYNIIQNENFNRLVNNSLLSTKYITTNKNRISRESILNNNALNTKKKLDNNKNIKIINDMFSYFNPETASKNPKVSKQALHTYDIHSKELINVISSFDKKLNEISCNKTTKDLNATKNISQYNIDSYESIVNTENKHIEELNNMEHIRIENNYEGQRKALEENLNHELNKLDNLIIKINNVSKDYNEIKYELSCVKIIYSKYKSDYEYVNTYNKSNSIRKASNNKKYAINPTRLNAKNNSLISNINNSIVTNKDVDIINKSKIKDNNKVNFLGKILNNNNNNISPLFNKKIVDVSLLNNVDISNINPNSKKNSLSLNTFENEDILHSKKKDLYDKIKFKEDEINVLNKEITIKEYILSCLRTDRYKIEDSIKELKHEIEKLIDILFLHYHKLLSSGKDTRSEGLIWIIKKIWLLKKDILMSYMPKYLDEKIINYLFQTAHKEMELHHIDTLMKDIKEVILNNRGVRIRKEFSNQVKDFLYSEIKEKNDILLKRIMKNYKDNYNSYFHIDTNICYDNNYSKTMSNNLAITEAVNQISNEKRKKNLLISISNKKAIHSKIDSKLSSTGIESNFEIAKNATENNYHKKSNTEGTSIFENKLSEIINITKTNNLLKNLDNKLSNNNEININLKNKTSNIDNHNCINIFNQYNNYNKAKTKKNSLCDINRIKTNNKNSKIYNITNEKNFQKHLKKLEEEVKVHYEDINKENLVNYLEKRELLDEDTKFLLDYLQILEDLKASIKKDLKIKKDIEIKRISKEFYFKNYENNYGVKLDVIVSIIVGEDNLNETMKIINKARKSHKEKIKLIRYYNPMSY